MPEQKCTVKGFGGSPHPYSWCIKPVEEMVDQSIEPEAWGLRLTAKYVGGLFNYADTLICDPKKGIAANCDGILGNKYVLETDNKCKDGSTLYKYVDNVSDGGNILTGGRPSICNGLIPSALGSATKINALGILNSFIADPKPECMKVNLKCHLVNKKNLARSYTGPSGAVSLSKEDVKNLGACDFVNNTHPIYGGVCPTRQGFDNLNKNPVDLNNLNLKDLGLTDLDINKEDNDILINLYYLSISLALLFILYKFMYKK
tara:strand:- start:6965 stop:7744 length:780 start_codon:yes stop_codon:yes gene_type:complete